MKKKLAVLFSFWILTTMLPLTSLAEISQGYETLHDYDQTYEQFSFSSGIVVQTGGDFFIADRGANSVIHAIDAPGIIDMGEVSLNDVTEAPQSGYQDTAMPLQGHTYVLRSFGKYAKIHIEDIKTVDEYTWLSSSEYEFEWAYQPDGTRNFEATISRSLVLHLPFDGNYNDISGFENHGTPNGNMGFTDGMIEQGAYFDGNSYIEIQDSDSLDLSTSFTFSVWLYKEDAGTGGWAVILSKGDTTGYDWDNARYRLHHDLSGVYPEVRLVENNIGSAITTNFKEWYHLAATWDGSHVKFYINGVLEDTKTLEGSLTDSTSKLLIGCDPPGVTEYFRGIMDDLRIYNYALSDNEIQSLSGEEGLFGEYMNFEAFTTGVGEQAPPGLFETATIVFTRTDPVINFTWEYGSPDPAVNVDNFGARWTGEIYAPVTGTYTFIVWSDDGNRLYVDNKIIIDDWTDHPPTRFEGTIDLTGGHWYPITLTFFEDADHASIHLYWEPPGGQEELIPSHNLKPTSGNIPDLTAVITTPFDNSIYLEDESINFAGSASGGIQPYSYTWVSNQDGQLNTGTSFSFGTLNPGTHHITLTVTDAGAQSATDQITLTITASTTGTILYIEDRTIASGTESQTKIMCTNAQNIGDFGIDITYDPSVIEILDVYKGALQNIVSTTQDWNILSPGTLRIGIITSQGITGDGSIAHIRFKAIGSSGDFTTLTLDANAHDANTFTAKTLLTYNGQITISSQIPIGDGNGDGKVTWLDALLALRMYVGKEPVNLILDVNHDGEVTPVDATMILKASLGKIILT